MLSMSSASCSYSEPRHHWAARRRRSTRDAGAEATHAAAAHSRGAERLVTSSSRGWRPAQAALGSPASARSSTMPHLRHGRCENGGIVVNATSSREEAAADLDCVQVGTDRVDCFLPYVDETSQDSRDASQGLDQDPATTSSAQPSTSQSDGLSDLLGLGLLVLPFALWGTSMVSTKLVLPDTSPYFVAISRLLPAGLILWGIAASRKAPLPRNAAAWGAVTLFGLVDGTLFQAFMANGLEHTSAGLSSVIIDSQPLTVAILAALFLNEPITAVAATGLAIGVLGLCVGLLPPSVFDSGDVFSAVLHLTGGGWGSGETELMAAAQSMAVGTVLARWVCKDMGVEPTMATGLHLVIGSLPLLAMSVSQEPELWARIAESGLPLADWGLLGFTSIFGGAVAYGIYFHAASKGSLVTLSSLTFLTPLFATVAGYFALGERLMPSQIAGGLVALGGVTLVVMSKAKAPASGGGGGGKGTASGAEVRASATQPDGASSAGGLKP